MESRLVLSLLVAAFAVTVSHTPAAQAPAAAAGIDAIFDRWTDETPGCTVGVSDGTHPPIARAYGMADLEHGVRNTPDTIFEAGSVSKQFTAAAVLLLAKDGRLSLDEPARKYVPELPDYGTPVTIRQMLTHTSGLRDWGSVSAIAGWPRTTRAYTHAHVLDIVSRQRSLNFAPGTRWSYSNTGYNLAAVVVARVSGMSVAEFTRTRMFTPLGMTRTSWRDDYTRVVKDRAIAYSREDDGYHTEMPFENVHGQGGLLTTVGDLLKWNASLDAGTLTGAALVRELEEPGRFADGRAHHYGLGLSIGRYKGVREIAHGGATAGYRSYLARYPDRKVSVAVLCNAANAAAGEYAHAAADPFLPAVDAAEPGASYTATAEDIQRAAGLYRSTVTGSTLELVAEGARLRVARGPELRAVSGSEFTTPDGRTWRLAGTRLMLSAVSGGETFERVPRAKPSAEDLAELTGTYVSEEAETSIDVAVQDGTLVLKMRPDSTLRVAPLYADAFRHPSAGTIIFRRDSQGRVTELSVVQDRVWDLRFARTVPER